MSELTLILHNIRSCHNVGSILRTADGFGVKTVIFSGYTPRFNDPNLLPHLREKLNHQIAKTALGAEQYLNLNFSNDITKTLTNLRAKNHLILGLENNLTDPRKITLAAKNFAELRSALQSAGKQRSAATSDQNSTSQNPAFSTPERLALLLGEEVSGINKDLYKYIDLFLEIPMKGKKESFNVSIAAAITMFCLENL